ncbi:MAG: alpha/beta hydrolase [Curtobacterium sp.]
MRPPLLSPYQSLMAATPVVHRAVRIDGRTTHYWVYGPEDATRTVLAVHGFRGDHHGLETIAAHLQGVRVVVPDLPGFGVSDPLRSSDIDSYVAWLTGFHGALGMDEQTVVLGHSFGSIVVAATVAAGLRTRLLVLVNPIAAPALHGPRAIATGVAIGYYKAGAVLPRPLGLALLRNPAIVRVMSIAMLKSHDRELRRWVHDQHDRYFSAFSDRTSVLEAFRTSVSHDVSEYAARIDVPVLMIAAEHDDITAVPEQQALAARLADAELVVVPGVGHLVHYETPAAAASAVLRRMDDGGPGRAASGRGGSRRGGGRARPGRAAATVTDGSEASRASRPAPGGERTS